MRALTHSLCSTSGIYVCIYIYKYIDIYKYKYIYIYIYLCSSFQQRSAYSRICLHTPDPHAFLWGEIHTQPSKFFSLPAFNLHSHRAHSTLKTLFTHSECIRAFAGTCSRPSAGACLGFASRVCATWRGATRMPTSTKCRWTDRNWACWCARARVCLGVYAYARVF
jgi:hypothetical protein